MYSEKNERVPARWSGGTTTQLAIYPENSSYAGRDFLFRISTATVEAETSEFTLLPGVQRILLILEGELRLTHEGHYQKHMRPFDQDTFPGDWKTTAAGKVTDFNLMLRENAEGEIKSMNIKRGDNVSNEMKWNFTGVYVLSGEILLQCVSSEKVMTAGAFLLIKDECVSIQTLSAGTFLLITVNV